MNIFAPYLPSPTRVSSAYGSGGGQRRGGSPISGCSGRLIIMLVIIAFAVFQYFSNTKEKNLFTGREQRLNLDPKEEIQMGLASAPQMAQQFGGLSKNAQATQLVKQIGAKLVSASDADETPYANNFDFHLLADRKTVNAFALPGGQIFITEALLSQLKTEDEVAGVIGHEIGHVVGRHSSEQIAKNNLINGITMGVLVGASGDGGGADSARIAQMVGQMVSMKYGRNDELESDRLACLFLLQAGYEPEAMIKVMEVLKKASGGGGGQPEWMSTHPNPENRAQVIKDEIARLRAKGSDKPGGTGKLPELQVEPPVEKAN